MKVLQTTITSAFNAFFLLSFILLALAETALANAQKNEGIADLERALIERAFVGGAEHGAELAVSPDGRYISVAISKESISINSHRLSWMVIDTSTYTTQMIDDGGELIINLGQNAVGGNGFEYPSGLRWSPDGKWIAYPKKIGDEVQIWRSRHDGGILEQISFNRANVLGMPNDAGRFEWSLDGTKIYFEVGRDRNQMAEIRRRESAIGFLFDNRFASQFSYAPMWLRCGGERGGYDSNPNEECEPRLFAVDVSTKEERLANKDETEEYASIRRRHDLERQPVTVSLPGNAQEGVLLTGKLVGFQEKPGGEQQLVVYYGDGRIKECMHEACNGFFMQGAWFLGDEVVFLRHQNSAGSSGVGHSGVYSWRPNEGEVVEISSTRDHIFGCRPANQKLFCFREGSTKPRRLVALDVETRSLETVFDPNPHLHDGVFSQVERREFVDEEGNPTFVEIVYPRNYQEGKTYPLIFVQRHPFDFGFLDGGTSNEYPIHLFAREGFLVVVSMSYLDLNAVYGGGGDLAILAREFEEDRRYKLGIAPFIQVITELTEKGMVDESLIGGTGFSTTSTNVRYAMINEPGLIAVASVNQGYSGPHRYWFASKYYRTRQESLRDLMGRPDAPAYTDEAQEAHRSTQLAYHAADVVFPPYLLQVSDRELSSALFDYVFLEDEEQAVEMYVFPDELHAKFQPIHRQSVYRRNLQWFKFWLQGEMVDDPLDPNQYRRWIEMCSNYVAKLEGSERPEERARAKHQPCSRVTMS